MKTHKFLIVFSTLFLCVGIMGCENENEKEEIVYPEAKIIKEFPYTSLLEEKVFAFKDSHSSDVFVVQSQKELENYYDKVPTLLKGINFKKHTLLMRTLTNDRVIVDLHCGFTKAKDNNYLLTVNVKECGKPDNSNPQYFFMPFAVLVEKIPSFATIKLEIISTEIPIP